MDPLSVTEIQWDMTELRSALTCLDSLEPEGKDDQEKQPSEAQSTMTQSSKMSGTSENDLEVSVSCPGRGLAKAVSLKTKPGSSDEDLGDADGATAQSKETKKFTLTELECYTSVLEEYKTNPEKYPNLYEDIERLVDHEVNEIRRNLFSIKSMPMKEARQPQCAKANIVKMNRIASVQKLPTSGRSQDTTLPEKNLGASKKTKPRQKKVKKAKVHNSLDGDAGPSNKGQEKEVKEDDDSEAPGESDKAFQTAVLVVNQLISKCIESLAESEQCSSSQTNPKIASEGEEGGHKEEVEGRQGEQILQLEDEEKQISFQGSNQGDQST